MSIAETNTTGARYKRCMAPGCGAVVLKLWNHMNQGKAHRHLTPDDRKHYIRVSNLAAGRGRERAVDFRPEEEFSTSMTTTKATTPAATSEATDEPLAPAERQKFTISSIGRQTYGDSRSMGSFPASLPDLVEFRR